MLKRVEVDTAPYHDKKDQYFVSRIKEDFSLGPLLDDPHFHDLKASTLSFKKKTDAENFALLELLKRIYSMGYLDEHLIFNADKVR